MLPHHQAAIDMAKTQLLYGKDPQMRRLAARDHHRSAVGDCTDATVADAARCAFGQSGTRIRPPRMKRNSMKKALALILLVLPVHVYAQQAPWGRPDIPVSSRDRVYAADQTSNTVSVIDPSSNTLLGVIRLGD